MYELQNPKPSTTSSTFSDRYASIVPVRGSSMSPTFNPTTDSFMGSLSDDHVLMEKFCLQKYKFSHGDVIVFWITSLTSTGGRTANCQLRDQSNTNVTSEIMFFTRFWLGALFLILTEFESVSSRRLICSVNSLHFAVCRCSPSNHKEKHVKRIIGLPGDWIGTPMTNDVVKVPNGHCWVEGDNPSSSLDSRSFGPIPLGLVKGRVTHILWPPQRVRHVERKNHQNRHSPS
ncbi:mitochondrial inner membrane protease subunit 2 [Citrus sinensis]|uniref:Mitochondrial inner membrane protease subunit 2 n=1 Tax=Citrus sinensis TaxID=2711 RepID=A0ACB8MEB9_CITSI|nr:mitochondrial inner membrane protease subunit 2 [Citrus sinensis]